MMRDWGGQKVSWVNRKLEFEWTCYVSTDKKTTLCWWSKRGVSLMLLPLLGYFVFFSFLAAAIEEKITKNRKLHCQRHHGAVSDYLDDIRIWVLKALRKYWHVSVKTQVFDNLVKMEKWQVSKQPLDRLGSSTQCWDEIASATEDHFCKSLYAS